MIKPATTIIRVLGIGCALVVLTGCETMAFYQQAITGQIRLLAARQPVAQLLADQQLPAQRRAGLQRSHDILEYAADTLGLHADGRYASFVDLRGDAVVWNVLAVPQYSLDARQWCYPIVGCAPYRGYFSEAKARAYAARLQADGYDIYVGGVPAYSTLGWFDDPLLSSFIDWPAADLANLLIHELAHSRVWVASEVEFNESFASFVGDVGTCGWLAANQQQPEYALWHRQRQAWRRLQALLLEFKDRLQAALQEVSAAPTKAQVQAGLYRQLHAEYARRKRDLGDGRFDRTMAQLNNAYLVSLGTYEDLVPAFATLFEQVNGEWPAFFAAVEALADLSAAQRSEQLAKLQAAAVDLPTYCTLLSSPAGQKP